MRNAWEYGDAEAAKVNAAYKGRNGNWLIVGLVLLFALLPLSFTYNDEYNPPRPLIWSIPVVCTLMAVAFVLWHNHGHKRRYEHFISTGRIVSCPETILAYSAALGALIDAEAKAKHMWRSRQVRELMTQYGELGEVEVARRVALLMQALDMPAGHSTAPAQE